MGTEDEGEEEGASVLAEAVEGAIPISQGLALVAEDLKLLGLALRQNGAFI